MNNELEQISDRLYNSCPDSLRTLPCWLLWKAITKDGKVLKVPYYTFGGPRGKHGSESDRLNLSTLEGVLEVFSGGGYTGIGIATLPEFNLTIGDFDDKRGEGLHPDAQAIAATTYAERSPGGRGIHAIWQGTMPSGKNNAIGVEVFGETGFVTFTGNRLNANEIEPLNDGVRNRLATLIKSSAMASDTNSIKAPLVVDDATVLALRSALRVMDATDYDTWQKNGHRLKSLGAVGRSLWMDWSCTDPRFDEREAAQKWDSFTGEETSYKAIFSTAQALGWVNPATAIAKQYEAFEALITSPHEEQEKPPRFFVPIGELLANKQPPDWLIHGHIESNGLALLFGSPSAGKSFLSLDWSLSIATAREWHGHKVKQGAVCYLAGEGFAGFKRRCAAWSKHNQVGIDGAPLYFNKKTVQLIDENSCFEARNAVNEIVTTHGPLSLLVLDTFNRTGGGDENSNTDAAKILHHVEKYFSRHFKCAVLIVHHVGHGEGERSRGASALPAGVDSAFVLTEKDGVRTLKATKQKESDLGPPQSFELHDVVLEDWPPDPDTGELQQSAVMVATDNPDETGKRRKLTPALSDAIDCLMLAVNDGLAVDSPPEVIKRFGLIAPTQCVPEDVWRELYYSCPSQASDKTLDAKRKAFRRAVDELLKRQLVNGSHGYYWRY